MHNPLNLTRFAVALLLLLPATGSTAADSGAPAVTALRVPDGGLQPADLMPTPQGFMMVWLALHEWLGRLAGA